MAPRSKVVSAAPLTWPPRTKRASNGLAPTRYTQTWTDLGRDRSSGPPAEERSACWPPGTLIMSFQAGLQPETTSAWVSSCCSGRRETVTHGSPRKAAHRFPGGRLDSHAASYQSTSNSFPSGSAITM